MPRTGRLVRRGSGLAAVRGGRGAASRIWWLLVGAVTVVYGAWPDFWSPTAGLLQGGLINYAPASSFAYGDNPHYAEYHWHGLQLIAGNLYVLAGLGLFAVVLVTAARLLRAGGSFVPPRRTPSGSLPRL